MDSVIKLLEIEFRVGTYFLNAFSGPLQVWKSGRARSTVVGIMCLPVEIGLTNLLKTEGGGRHTLTPDCDSPDFMFNVP